MPPPPVAGTQPATHPWFWTTPLSYDGRRARSARRARGPNLHRLTAGIRPQSQRHRRTLGLPQENDAQQPTSWTTPSVSKPPSTGPSTNSTCIPKWRCGGRTLQRTSGPLSKRHVYHATIHRRCRSHYRATDLTDSHTRSQVDP